jgi:hypothetical protein
MAGGGIMTKVSKRWMIYIGISSDFPLCTINMCGAYMNIAMGMEVTSLAWHIMRSPLISGS